MARYDFNAQRLFVEADLAEAATVSCSSAQANYLKNVLRLKAGDDILVFNGRDGEWRSELAEAGKRGASLLIHAQVRPQEGGPDIDYLFAPLKLARLQPGPLALLIGPEGGFDESERALLASKPYVARISLGPRILRADTAAVAALALVNAVLGDWR